MRVSENKDKAELRRQLEEEVQDFLNKGGEINKVEVGSTGQNAMKVPFMKRNPTRGVNKKFDEVDKKKSVFKELMGMLGGKNEKD